MMRSTKKAGYINTGTWASGAIKEAKKVGVDVHVFASSEDKNFTYIPRGYEIPSDIDYVHFTSNNTIYGTQFKEFPKTDLPLVCDMSSDIFSKDVIYRLSTQLPIDYAGFSKSSLNSSNKIGKNFLYHVSNCPLKKVTYKARCAMMGRMKIFGKYI
jgi:phosphoserine aminotransferase